MKYLIVAVAFSFLAACSDAPESSETSSNDNGSSTVIVSSEKDPMVENFPGGDLVDTIESMIKEAGKEKNREYLNTVSQEPMTESDLKSVKGVYSDIKVSNCSGSKAGFRYDDNYDAPQLFSCKVRLKVSYFNQDPFVSQTNIETRLGDRNGIKEGDKLEINGDWENFHSDVIKDKST